jgi:hypothetical protein
MKSRITALSVSCLLAVPAAFAGEGADEPAWHGIDALFDQGMRENHSAKGLALLQESLDACVAALKVEPARYDLLWRCARSAVERAETSRILRTRDWKTVFRSLGGKAVVWGDAAKRAAPDRVEGYYWQLQAMGLIFDADGALSFLAKGYAPRSREDLEACYRLDRSYLDFTPVLALALYWSSLPPLLGQDMNKALAYFDEFAARTQWGFEPYRQLPSAAALLLKAGTADRVEQARALLTKALSDPTPRPAYEEMARRLLARIAPSAR